MKIVINKVIKILILSDVALISGFGFITPIFAIFLTDRIEGGNVEVAGYAAAIYWIVMSLVVIPLGRYLDKNHGEKDDLWFIIIGRFSNLWLSFFLSALAYLSFTNSLRSGHGHEHPGVYGYFYPAY